MARLEDLVSQVQDATLRRNLELAVEELKRRQRFGLVFEGHIPETAALVGLEVRPGSTVQRRSDADGRSLYQVQEVNDSGKKAKLVSLNSGETAVANTSDFLVVKRFGEPIYPCLTPIGNTRRAPASRPAHAVINGENYHSLQLFAYLFRRRVDCIYLDPPFNTGARDWKYNNRYVDQTDAWRHSKWLSFMEKRLRLAKRLLKDDGVLICAIDDNEASHLEMLSERIFPEYSRYVVTVVINPKGRDKLNFAPVHEYALFMVPDNGEDIINRFPIESPGGDIIGASSKVVELDDYGEGQEGGTSEPVEVPPGTESWETRHARRRGGGAERSSYRERRPGQFYPILIDEQKRIVVRVGNVLPPGHSPTLAQVDGLTPVWPIDEEGGERCWAFKPESMQELIDQGRVFLGRYHKDRKTWTINYRVPRKATRKLKSVWVQREYDAGTHGTQLVRRLLGKPGLFPFPKSVYLVADCIGAVVRDRPKALIMDVFAGSGTTFHATCLLNAADGGSRRSILVTNNEVAESVARDLANQHVYRGDPAFEQNGIFELVTRPRCKATITGLRPDGTPIEGSHARLYGSRPFADGFSENVEFFRLDYLNPDDVDLGRQFDAIHPSLWLAAGGLGNMPPSAVRRDFVLPAGSSYGVLFRESSFGRFRKALGGRPDVTHVWLVTDSEEAYAEMRGELPRRLRVSMLYRDYLRNFAINTEHTG